jgi:hypothetical protein
MCIKFCLKLSKINIGACDKLELSCRGEMNRTQTFMCSSEFTTWCNCASEVCSINVLWCLSKIKYNTDVFMLKWKYLLLCLWSNVWLNAVWLLFSTFCTPQIQSTMIFLFPKLKLYPAGRTENHLTAGLTTLSSCKEISSIMIA